MQIRQVKGTLFPPPGSPNWKAGNDTRLPLLYLAWGQRNYKRSPLRSHSDIGFNYIVLLEGEIILTIDQKQKTVQAPYGIVLDQDCLWGISQKEDQSVRVLSWVWKGSPTISALKPKSQGSLEMPLVEKGIASLKRLHDECRREVERSDRFVVRSLQSLRTLIEIAILRAAPKQDDFEVSRWKQAISWMGSNLSIHSPVPALCDFLEMSPASLHRFFKKHSGISPGLCFRKLKTAEARRLIGREGYSIKLAAYELGYQHPSDLTRALRQK